MLQLISRKFQPDCKGMKRGNQICGTYWSENLLIRKPTGHKEYASDVSNTRLAYVRGKRSDEISDECSRLRSRFRSHSHLAGATKKLFLEINIFRS